MQPPRTNAAGFTLIEMIVSLGVFAVVITISIGALLVLIASNEQLQKEQSVMTNLSFALDSMTREMRTGTDFYCRSRNNYSNGGSNNMFADGNNLDDIHDPAVGGRGDWKDCTQEDGGVLHQEDRDIHGLTFKEAGDSITGTAPGDRSGGGENERILYFFDEDEQKLFRRVGSQEPQSIVSSAINIVNAHFIVSGADPQSAGDDSQVLVTVFIEAQEVNSDKSFFLQTSVVQRTLDI